MGRTGRDQAGFSHYSAKGRGKGKTRFAQNFARVFGGYLDVSPQEDIAAIKTRFLSPQAAQKRIATLDNLKTARFSWGDFENLITADTINGKRLYIGDASRPNLITWTITLNGASLSTDMAQRVVEIRLAEPSYSDTWEEEVAAFIDANREKIVADCLGFCNGPAKPMKRHTRWATWEAQVLSKVDHPDDCVSLILDRRGAVDVEQEESTIIEDYFANKLAGLGYDPERDDVFIPNDVAARWFNAATGDRKKLQASPGPSNSCTTRGACIGCCHAAAATGPPGLPLGGGTHRRRGRYPLRPKNENCKQTPRATGAHPGDGEIMVDRTLRTLSALFYPYRVQGKRGRHKKRE